MAKGNIAKEKVVKILKEAFGENYIGEVQKKYYVWADDGGEKVQIAISLTCPKTFVETAEATVSSGGDFNFEDEPQVILKAPAESHAEITEEEKYNIETLMKRLGL